jgi:hypothetical protein
MGVSPLAYHSNYSEKIGISALVLALLALPVKGQGHQWAFRRGSASFVMEMHALKGQTHKNCRESMY